MPMIDPGRAPAHPAPSDEPDPDLGPYRSVALGDAGALTQFGVNLETLPPGSKSSHKHWHAEEDEFVYVLSGELVLIEGKAEFKMRTGDAAAFKAGAGPGHRLENRSSAEATFLVVGTRSDDETVTYPDLQIKLVRRDGETTRVDL